VVEIYTKRKITKMKKINRITVYYDDGTYEEINNNVPGQQGDQNKKVIETGPLKQTPWNPYYVPTTDKAPWDPPFTITFGTGSVPLKYTVDPQSGAWAFKSTYNFAPSDKYTITSSGSGYNVGTSK
jgi:hypothetical protein